MKRYNLWVIDPMTNQKKLLVQEYSELVWTERFSDKSDVKAKIPYKKGLLSAITLGDYLYLDGCNTSMMVITSIENEEADNSYLVTFTGTDLFNYILSRTYPPADLSLKIATTEEVENTVKTLYEYSEPSKNVSMSLSSVNTQSFDLPYYPKSQEALESKLGSDAYSTLTNIQSLYGFRVRSYFNISDTSDKDLKVELCYGAINHINDIESPLWKPNIEYTLYSYKYDTLMAEHLLNEATEIANTAVVKLPEKSTLGGGGILTTPIVSKDVEYSRKPLDAGQVYIDASSIKTKTDDNKDKSVTQINNEVTSLVNTYVDGYLGSTTFECEIAGDSLFSRLGSYVCLESYLFGKEVGQISEVIYSINSEGIKYYPSFKMFGD